MTLDHPFTFLLLPSIFLASHLRQQLSCDLRHLVCEASPLNPAAIHMKVLVIEQLLVNVRGERSVGNFISSTCV